MFTAVIVENFEMEDSEKNEMQKNIYRQKLRMVEAHRIAKQAILGRAKVPEEAASVIADSTFLEQDAKGNTLTNRKKAYVMLDETYHANSVIGQNMSMEDAPPKPPPSLMDPDVDYVERSCLCCGPENKFRELSLRVTEHWTFEALILACIFYSGALLAADRVWNPDPFIRSLVDYSDPCLLLIFTIELAMKVTAFGFYGSPTAYIMDPWNRIDVTVVVVSYLGLFLTFLPSAIARILRTGRCIRPLRLINRSPRIRMVFEALSRAWFDIFQVVFLSLFAVFTFAVLGMTFFMGHFYSCNQKDATGKLDCKGFGDPEGLLGYPVPFVWSNPRSNLNFDSITEAIRCVFVCSTMDGWVEVMYNGMDVTHRDKQPKTNASRYYATYFVLLVFLCGVFFLNLTMGVIIEKFNQMSGSGVYTYEQKSFKNLLIEITTQDVRRPVEEIVRCTALSKIFQTPLFEKLLLCLIVANAGIMASEHYRQSATFAASVNTINSIFVFVFAAELLLRMLTMGTRKYLRADYWNVFDAFIVFGCLAIEFLGSTGLPLQALRPIRLLLLLRMIRQDRGIKTIVNTLLESIPTIFNICCLVFLVLFVFAVVGMQLFGNVRNGVMLNTHANFRYFQNALLLLVRSVTGEGWSLIMNDCMVGPPACTPYEQTVDGYYLPNDCGQGKIAVAYFITFYCVGVFVIFNLFVAVVLDHFTTVKTLEDALIGEDDLRVYYRTWYAITLADPDMESCDGKYMKLHNVYDFMLRLGPPLGFDKWTNEARNCYKNVMQECRMKHVALERLQTDGTKLEQNPLAGNTFDTIDDSSLEMAPLSPTEKPEAGHQRSGMDEAVENVVTWKGIDYKQLLHMLVMYKQDTADLPYEDRLNRENELTDITLYRLGTLMTSMGRGLLERTRLLRKAKREAERQLRPEIKAEHFKDHFANVLQNEDLQAELGLLDDEDLQKPPTTFEVTLPAFDKEEEDEEELEPNCDPPEAVVTSKLQDVFAERARKRKELREKRRVQIRGAAETQESQGL